MKRLALAGLALALFSTAAAAQSIDLGAVVPQAAGGTATGRIVQLVGRWSRRTSSSFVEPSVSMPCLRKQ